jgi:hypothetical protein
MSLVQGVRVGMQDSKKRLLVKRFSDHEAVPVAVAPGAICQDVLEAIGERGALGLATGPGPGLFIILTKATVWNWVCEGQTLFVVIVNYPC